MQHRGLFDNGEAASVLEGWAKTKPPGSSWALLVVKAQLTVFSENRGSPSREDPSERHKW